MITLLLTGCMSFDGFAFPAVQVDQYELDFDIPAAQVELVDFESEDGTKLYGVWARQAEPAPPMIYFHGYGGNLDTSGDRLEYYWGWGTHDVFMVDYRGYGMSEGTPSAEGVLEMDGLATVEFVADSEGVASEDIPVLSLSLGGSVAIHTNDEIDVQVVITESTFASSDDVIDDSSGLDLPAGWFFEQQMDNVAAVASIRSPILIIHGDSDTFVPPWHGQLLFDAAPEDKAFWQPEGVEHSDLPEVYPEEFEQRALGFIEEWE